MPEPLCPLCPSLNLCTFFETPAQSWGWGWAGHKVSVAGEPTLGGKGKQHQQQAPTRWGKIRITPKEGCERKRRRKHRTT